MAPVIGDLWVPLGADPLLRPAVDPATRLDAMSLHLVGRLKPGVDRTQAEAELDSIGHQLRRERGEADQGPAVTVYRGTILHPEVAAPVTVFIGILMALVAVVLLIVCVNVANLVLARAAGRHTEMAVRQALGAGRARLIRQLLTENLLLALAGAAAGVTLAFWMTRLLTTIDLPTPVPVALDLSIDWRVVAFTMAAAVAATVAFGLMPALTASRIDLIRAVREANTEGPRHGRLRSAFLIAQVSMSVLLLISAGLFIRSFRNARAIDTGFDAAGVMTASLDLDTRGYSAARGSELIRSLTSRLESAPEIAAVNAVDMVPVTLSSATTYLLRAGDAAPAEGQLPPTPQVYINAVGPGHFRTLRIGMLGGRDFTDADANAGAPVLAGAVGSGPARA
jgi:predicted permease